MFSQAIAVLLLLSAGHAEDQAEPQAKAAPSRLAGACKRLGVVEVCHRGEVAEVRVRGERTKLLDGLLSDEDTQFRIRRASSNAYVVEVGNSGPISDNPWNNLYSIEIAVSKAGYRVTRLSDVGDAKCANQLVPYSSSIDLEAGRVSYEFGMEGDAPEAERTFSYPVSSGMVTAAPDVSYDDHLNVLAATPGPDERAICRATGFR